MNMAFVVKWYIIKTQLIKEIIFDEASQEQISIIIPKPINNLYHNYLELV